MAPSLAFFLATTPASALMMTLSFDESICGAADNMACSNGFEIGQQYGDSAEADVSYQSLNFDRLVAENYLKYRRSSYGDLTGLCRA